MKKMMMTLAAVLCCAMTTTVFTACSSSDDDDNTKKPDQDAPATGVMECTLYTNDESLASFDFFVKYYDDNGLMQSEKVAWDNQLNNQGLRTWTKKVVAKLPATLGILFEIKAKDGIDLEGQYRLTSGYNVTFASYTASGKIIDSYTPASSFESIQNRKGMLEEALKDLSNHLNIIYKYDSNGKGAGTSKWE